MQLFVIITSSMTLQCDFEKPQILAKNKTVGIAGDNIMCQFLVWNKSVTSRKAETDIVFMIQITHFTITPLATLTNMV